MDPRQSSSTAKEAPAPFRFLPAEVKEMEERLFPVTNRRLDHALMDELAVKFSHSRDRAGMVPVKPKQVLNWFNNNRYKVCAKIAREEPHAPMSTKQQAQGSSISKLKPPSVVTKHAGSSSGERCYRPVTIRSLMLLCVDLC